MYLILEKGCGLLISLPAPFPSTKKMSLFVSEVATTLKNNKKPALAYCRYANGYLFIFIHFTSWVIS